MSHIAKQSGNSELEKPLEIGKEYSINNVVSVTAITKKTKDNGEFDFYYTCKPTLITLVNDLGQKLSIPKEKGSLSQQNHQVLSQFYKHEVLKSGKYEIEFLKLYALWWEIVNKKQPEIFKEVIEELEKKYKV